MSRNFETHDWQWYGVKRIKPIFSENGNSRAGFGPPLYFFNKTDLKQYLSKELIIWRSIKSWYNQCVSFEAHQIFIQVRIVLNFVFVKQGTIN